MDRHLTTCRRKSSKRSGGDASGNAKNVCGEEIDAGRDDVFNPLDFIKEPDAGRGEAFNQALPEMPPTVYEFHSSHLARIKGELAHRMPKYFWPM